MNFRAFEIQLAWGPFRRPDERQQKEDVSAFYVSVECLFQ